MRALILCGGKGIRLRPLTLEFNKVMIPVHTHFNIPHQNYRTLLDNVLELFYGYGIYETWLLGGYKSYQLQDRYTCPIINEKHSTGTGGWLRYLNHLKFKDDFFVCNGDNLFDLNLKEMYDYHKKRKVLATIACTHVKDIRPFGAVHMKDGLVQSFEEKKKCRTKKSGYINAGYYIFSPKIFNYVKKLNLPEDKPISLEYDIFPRLAKEKQLAAFYSDAQWFSCNTFKEYGELIKNWRGINVKGSVITKKETTKKDGKTTKNKSA